jgi:hypothetical protein
VAICCPFFVVVVGWQTKRMMIESLRRRRQVRVIEQQLAALTPSIHEANSMAKEMNKPVRFEVKLAVKKSGHSIRTPLESEIKQQQQQQQQPNAGGGNDSNAGDANNNADAQSFLDGKTVCEILIVLNYFICFMPVFFHSIWSVSFFFRMHGSTLYSVYACPSLSRWRL